MALWMPQRHHPRLQILAVYRWQQVLNTNQDWMAIMAYKVPVKEHQEFMTTLYQRKDSIRNYNRWLVQTSINAERRHCISVGHHFDKLLGNVCYFCGGDR